MDYRAYEVSRRELWIDLFKTELFKLHAEGFVHRDLKRPSNIGGDRFDNIMLTDKGLRLIDVGISVLRSHVSEQMFERYISQELDELKIFEEYFLSR